MTSTAVSAHRSRRWESLTTLRSRFTFRFSATGTSAAALVADGNGAAYVEYWQFGAAHSCRPLAATVTPASSIDQLGVPTDPVPYDDGRVLLLRRRTNSVEVLVAEPDRDLRTLAELPFPHARIVPPPDASGGALLVVRDPSGRGSLWGLDDLDSAPRRLADLPTPHLTGGGWLDAAGRRYALNVRAAGIVRPVAVDASDGTVRPIPRLVDGANQHVVLTSPATGRSLLATDAGGRWRLADLHPDQGGEIRYADAAEHLDGEVFPLALDPAGEQVLLHVRRGALSRLVVYGLSDQRVRAVPTPEGSVGGAAVWTCQNGQQRIRSLFVSGTHPFRVLTFDPDRPHQRRLDADGTAAGEDTGWAAARVVDLPGADGPIEVIAHGRHDWRTGGRLLVALHGGPEQSWTMKFDHFFQYLAADEITVLAPNSRGSVGYGESHQHAIRGAWAGPDLADLRALGRHLREQRPPDAPRPMLYGHSYGAYLALVAAAADPDAWSRVAAVAPFLSGRRLFDVASPEVRSMLDRLGACRDIDDALGPRDVLRLADRIRARLLIVHGSADPVIPVGQSRALRDELLRLGWRDGEDFRYREVAGADHHPIDGSPGLHAEVARFLFGTG